MKIIKKISYFIPVITAAAMISGCVSQPAKPLYNYGNYSDSYYAYKKNMTPETTLALQNSMEKVISETELSQSGRVPPGMYANLGYLYIKAGKPNDAIANFTKEKSIYPEATFFMDRIINKIQETEGNKK